jgi:ankyrin repeat protein
MRNILKAIAKGDIAKGRALLASTADINEKKFEGTLLTVAVEKGDQKIVELLLTHPEIDVNKAHKGGATPLIIASQRGFKEIVARLLRHPDIDVNSATTARGDTPLHQASQNGHKEVVELLLMHPSIEVNKPSRDGGALHAAAANGHRAIVELLLTVPGIDINLEIAGRTPLSRAIQSSDNEAIIELLLHTPGINIYQAHGNITLLPCAILHNYENVVRILLKHSGINVNEVGLRWPNHTPLAFAVAIKNITIIQLLLEREDIDVNKVAQKGETPLAIAAANGSKEIVEILLQYPGIDLNRTGVGYIRTDEVTAKTPLHAAVSAGQLEIVSLLLSQPSIDINKATKYGSPLHAAVENNHLKIVQMLIDKDADINLQNSDGQTPLMLACKGKGGYGEVDIEVISILISQGAHLSLEDSFGKTALMITTERLEKETKYPISSEKINAFKFVLSMLDTAEAADAFLDKRSEIPVFDHSEDNLFITRITNYFLKHLDLEIGQWDRFQSYCIVNNINSGITITSLAQKEDESIIDECADLLGSINLPSEFEH